MPKKLIRYIFFPLLILAILLAGCARHGQYQSNKPSLSANEYMQLAATANGTRQQDFLLLAASRLIEDQKLYRAQTILNETRAAESTPEQQAQRKLLQAQIWLAKNNVNAAATLLTEVQQDGATLPAALQIKSHRLLAKAYEAQGQMLLSIDQNTDALDLMTSKKERQALLLKIWEDLQTQSPEYLASLLNQAATDNERGWIALARLSQAQLTTSQMVTAIQHWQQEFPKHPAHVLLGNEPLKTPAAMPNMPTQVALLLPLTGRLAPEANAIRNGFLAAYYQAKKQAPAPKIVVLDTHNKNIQAVYQQAIDQGSDFIVGPLTKKRLTELTQSGELKLPTLALNTLDNASEHQTNLFQFGLSPQDEATQAAVKMWNDHHARTIIIAPQGAWGKSVSDAFAKEWNALGGQTVTDLRYPKHHNLNRSIQDLLNIQYAARRKRQLETILHEKLRFIPRRRKDVDAIFLIANTATAQQILPLLRFYYAGSIPVYTISSAYSGQQDASANHDLNGLIFDDMPWILAPSNLPAPIAQMQQRVKRLWPHNYQKFSRLFALGVDSYNVIAQLGKLALLPQFSINGATGRLYLLANQRLYRKLLWAKIRRNHPHLLRGTATPFALNNE